MANLREIHVPEGGRDAGAVLRYVRELEAQLQYVLRHLGAENVQPGSIGPGQLSPQVRSQWDTVEKTVKDVHRNVSAYRQSADAIALEVRRMAEEGVEKVSNAALTIDADGIDLEGGEISLRAGSAFRAKSGGVFELFAADDESFLKFGGTEENPNASLGKGGTLKVKTIYADEIHARYNDLTADTGLSNRLVVAAEQPEGHGILWVQPQQWSALDYTLSNSGPLAMDGALSRQTLPAYTRAGESGLTGTACRYGVKFNIYNYAGACVWISVKVTLARADGTGSALTIYEATPRTQVGVGDFFRVDTLSSPSGPLENLTDAAQLVLTVTIKKSDATSARFVVDEPHILRCFSADGSSASGPVNCSIKYIP